MIDPGCCPPCCLQLRFKLRGLPVPAVTSLQYQEEWSKLYDKVGSYQTTDVAWAALPLAAAAIEAAAAAGGGAA